MCAKNDKKVNNNIAVSRNESESHQTDSYSDDVRQIANLSAEDEPNVESYLSNVIMVGHHARSNTTPPDDAETLLYTPVEIEGVSGTALVDCGATSMFIAKTFVDRHKLHVSRATGFIKDGVEEKLTDRIGTVSEYDSIKMAAIFC